MVAPHVALKGPPEGMQTKRIDAKYCSAACRQREPAGRASEQLDAARLATVKVGPTVG
jgi:hypothetical protein